LNLGKAGEDKAVKLLEENGYRILARNYKTRFAEIDIIAKDKDTICFIEVKIRAQDRFGDPKEAVNLAKQRKISFAAMQFLKERGLFDEKARFDVVSILEAGNAAKVEIVKDAFECGG
jgi:putative endonuclease